ncbi:MAG: hypothetical protein NT113_06995 [Hyphomicrobiales bacterium]|nr:hypothetical protein [Hyphomicrobiales bacterium]
MTQASEIAALREALREIIAIPVGYHAAAKMEGIARAALSRSASLPATSTEPVAFMFWNEPDTQRHLSLLRETIGSHWTQIVPLYAGPALTVNQ